MPDQSTQTTADRPWAEAQNDRLLDAVLAIGAELELPVVLRRIVSAAMDLVDARYGALGVMAPDGTSVEELVYVGMDERTVQTIGALPTFCGVLGVLIDDPRPMRLADVGSHPRAFGFPVGHPRMRSFLGVPIRLRDSTLGNLYLAEKTTAAEFTAEDERFATALAGAAAVAVQNARLYAQARQREAWLRAASEITRMLLSGAEEVEVYAAIAEHVRSLCDAGDASVFMPKGDGALRSIAAAGPVATEHLGMELDPEHSVTAKVFREGAAVNLRADEAARAQRGSAAQLPVGPALMVPLAAAGRTRGVLTASRRAGAEPFPAKALEALQGFAEQAELACELAERRRDSEALSLFADRDRIARNLHDLVIQRLFATGMVLESAAHTAAVDPVDAAKRIRNAVAELDSTIREIRTTVFALQQPADRSWSLRARIIEVVDDAAATLGFEPSVQFDGLIDTTVDEGTAEHALAVLREALSNVVRHARASAVGVTVSAHREFVLQVRDDGVGTPAGGRRSGLANMAARAEQLGGRLQITDGGPGTVLRWAVPLAPDRADQDQD